MPTTPVFGWPYLNRGTDPLTYGAVSGEDVLLAIEATASALEGRIAALETQTGFDRLAESILSGTAASVVFSSIPATYRSLQLQILCRGDTAAAFTPVRLRFNGDSGANYDAEQNSAVGSSATAFEGLNQTAADIGETSAANAVSGSVGLFTVFIPWYANTTFWKSLTCSQMLQAQTSGGQAAAIHSKHWVSRWRNTGAINSITILPNAGSFIAGSSFVLYGLP